jgi:hypothetical protein
MSDDELAVEISRLTVVLGVTQELGRKEKETEVNHGIPQRAFFNPLSFLFISTVP